MLTYIIRILSFMIFCGATLILSFSPISWAEDSGTLTLHGTIKDDGCIIDVGSQSQTVTLDKVAVSSLLTKGATAAPTPFNITLSKCPAALTGQYINLRFTGSADSNDGTLFKNTGSAQGVGIQLSGAQGEIINVGSNSAGYYVTSGVNTLKFTARYAASLSAPNVKSGSVESDAQFVINYP